MSWRQGTCRGILHQSHKWITPPGHTTAKWRSTLKTAWSDLHRSETRRALQVALRQTDGDMGIHPVDHTWQLYTQALFEAFHKAATMIPLPSEDSFHRNFRHWQRKAQAATPKLATQKHMKVSPRNRRTCGTMQHRKQQNWLNRATRLHNLLGREALTQAQRQEVISLHPWTVSNLPRTLIKHNKRRFATTTNMERFPFVTYNGAITHTDQQTLQNLHEY